MFKVGLQMSKKIDKYIKNKCPSYEDNKISNLLGSDDVQAVGRLLYYYPSFNSDDGTNWCGWHNDHCALTCLTPAIFQND